MAMVEINTKVQTPTQRARANVARLKELHQRPGVRVVPRDDDMRRLLKHPRAGGFRSEGSLEWPNDTFTQKRLRDGSIKLAEEGQSEQPKEGQSETSQQQVEEKPRTERQRPPRQSY
jgi:hypothetical protein